MQTSESLDLLASLYDRGLLVPFIGSGMSAGPCVLWNQLIDRLEQAAGMPKSLSPAGDPAERAEAVMQVLRRRRAEVAQDIRAAVYCASQREAPTHCDALARLRWPLICTTNYDDVYLRASLVQAAQAQRGKAPRVLGRSEAHCREVLRHLALPMGEIVWALQGLLAPEPFAVPREPNGKTHLDIQEAVQESGDLSQEIVLGHLEYRRASHRQPHFRRCFAEVFRARSFLFLGSGLTEPYFRGLFDEVLELVGPPAVPHFALVAGGSLDETFLRRQYHIHCIAYDRPEGDSRHQAVGQFIDALAGCIHGPRVKTHIWGWQLPRAQPGMPGPEGAAPRVDLPDFSIVQGDAPLSKSLLAAGEMVGISCGRKHAKPGGELIASPGLRTKTLLAKELDERPTWLGDHLVQWEDSQSWLCGIVARDPGVASSREARSPDAVRQAFTCFLALAHGAGKSQVHVQHLSAGELKTFDGWISIVQMARAYGAWRRSTPQARLRVRMYVRDVEALALLRGNHLSLADELSDMPMRLHVEEIDAAAGVHRHQVLVMQAATLGALLRQLGMAGTNPRLHAVPQPGKTPRRVLLNSVSHQSLGSFGLVSGSTLVIDHR